jgi:hypothetical protein
VHRNAKEFRKKISLLISFSKKKNAIERKDGERRTEKKRRLIEKREI